VSGRRKALIIANDEYQQEALRNLLAPAADAEALGRVLGDPQIGDFAVQVVRNESRDVIEAQIEDLFLESRPDDVLLLHFSGHGLKSESGELFFAACNTLPNRLGSTAVAADFVRRCMRDSRSRSIVLLLDCCYAGAFPQGVTARAAGDVNVLDSFPQGRPGGRGRAVITASNAMEYAFEGDRLADDQHRRPSVFTSALVEGLATGEADRDEDGLVSLNELYDYIFDKVREQNPHQTPSRQVELEGELYLARSRRRRIRPAPVPPDLQAAITDQNMFTRRGAVHELESRLGSEDLPVAAGAYEVLAGLARTDIRFVADPAAAALAQAAVRPEETELHFGEQRQGSDPPHRMVRLLGPPIARACAPRVSDEWIRVTERIEGLDISVDTTGTGTLRGSVDLKGPTGEAIIAVNVELLPQAPQTPAPEPPSTSAPPAPDRPKRRFTAKPRQQAQQDAKREAAEQGSQDAGEATVPVPPTLELSSSALDFGSIRAGSRPKPRRVKVRNAGGGDLNARIASVPAWIEAQLTGDTLILQAEPKAPGSLLGDVVIGSDGGSAAIRVTADCVADQAQPPARGLSVLRSKRTYSRIYRSAARVPRAAAAIMAILGRWLRRPGVRYGMFCVVGLAIGIGFTIWAVIDNRQVYYGNYQSYYPVSTEVRVALISIAAFGYVVALIMLIMFGLARRARRRNSPP
jgi:Caspase domain